MQYADDSKCIRGFGYVWANGCCRYWYVDKQGDRRWSDNDKLVEEAAFYSAPKWKGKR